MLPEPLHFATWPYGHSGRVRSTTPLVRCDAGICAGARPVATHCSIAAILSKTSVPGPLLAIIHARHHVELDGAPRVFAAQARDGLLKEIHGVVRGNLRIAPAVIDEQLAAAVDERLQVGVRRSQHAFVGVVRPCAGPWTD